MIRVLFVCTGNICRSPTAEGVLRRLAEEAGLGDRIEIESAGTHDYHVGDPPDRRAQETAQARGYDLSAQRARRVAADDFGRFDYILALDRGHASILGRQCPPDGRERIRLLLDFASTDQGGDVPDPYYGGPEDYELALDLIEDAARGLMDHLKRTHFA